VVAFEIVWSNVPVHVAERDWEKVMFMGEIYELPIIVSFLSEHFIC
jgi:hypothetical protein